MYLKNDWYISFFNMSRPKRLERSPRMINIDNDLNEQLTKNYPNQASDLINEALRAKIDKVKEKTGDLIDSETNAGRIAYAQALEKLGYTKSTAWNALPTEEKSKFVKLYRERLVDLQSRGF